MLPHETLKNKVAIAMRRKADLLTAYYGVEGHETDADVHEIIHRLQGEVLAYRSVLDAINGDGYLLNAAVTGRIANREDLGVCGQIEK